MWLAYAGHVVAAFGRSEKDQHKKSKICVLIKQLRVKQGFIIFSASNIPQWE